MKYREIMDQETAQKIKATLKARRLARNKNELEEAIDKENKVLPIGKNKKLVNKIFASDALDELFG